MIFQKLGFFGRIRRESDQFPARLSRHARYREPARTRRSRFSVRLGLCRGLSRASEPGELRSRHYASSEAEEHSSRLGQHGSRICRRSAPRRKRNVLARDDRLGLPLHRFVRHGLGHHRRLFRPRQRRMPPVFAPSRPAFPKRFSPPPPACSSRFRPSSSTTSFFKTFEFSRSASHVLNGSRRANRKILLADCVPRPTEPHQETYAANIQIDPIVLSEINMVPFIDIVLVLLIIFHDHRSNPSVEHRGRCSQDQNDPRNQRTKDCRHDGQGAKGYPGNDPINIHDFGARIKAKMKPNEGIFLRCDKNVPFGAFASRDGRLPAGRHHQISIVTEPYPKKRKVDLIPVLTAGR